MDIQTVDRNGREMRLYAVNYTTGADNRRWSAYFHAYDMDDAIERLHCLRAGSAEPEQVVEQLPAHADMQSPRHAYVPHKKYPWFCRDCGYPPHETLKHIQDEPTSAKGGGRR